ncbi:uncharacterized protein PV07_02837 [Cladophialophora immunda]|uniref:Uncharacterized protein n=1 Tax=Cladophialophora immunda TaxID=569365 RepID=A0A0D2CJ46_9EURO|nr:uncharacterized protein PV07_02837 [Cladophialophora immunda]KIW31168.1 hypothetical protein PV07_02837 [Cladophialophora immunda]OQV00136.1 hypothetical protein CLAIMM_05674 [Cladophialophora immunda]
MSLPFQDKVAFVTGGASGIGFAIARKLAELGAKVAIGDVNLASAIEAAASVGKSCLAVGVDVADERSVRDAISQVEDRFGGLHLAANCAGVQLPVGPIADLGASNIAKTLDINLKGMIYCLKHEVTLMKKNGGLGGAIVNIASAAASQPLAYNGPYSASKAGVVAITKSAAAEVAPDHIRINSISPGYIDTPMMRRVNIDTDFAAARTPIGRCGEPEDVADLATFLLNDGAKQIHGIDVPIDGGMLLGQMVKPPGY